MPRSRHDDDDDDRRRRRRRDDDDHDPRRGGGGAPVGLIVGGVVGGVVLVVGVILAVVLGGRKPPPPAEGAANAPDAVPALRPNVVPPPVIGGRADELPQPPRTRPLVGLPMPAGTPSVRQVAFAGGEDDVVGLLSDQPDGSGERLTLAKTKTGEKIGAVSIDVKDSGYGYAVAPGGRFAAVKGIGPFEGDPLILHDLSSGQSFRFTPYSLKGGAITNPRLVGFGFSGADRLVTVTDRSGFDVWKLPEMNRLGGQPSRPVGSIPFVGTAGVGWVPSNYGLSADGKTLAVFDGTGFSFFDTVTAAGKARTEPLIQPNGSMNFWGAAFSADGSRFACLCSAYQPKESTALLVWNPATGKREVATPITDRGSGSGLAWWGPGHVLTWEGGQVSAEVMAVRTGQIVARVEMALTGGRLIATVTPGDKLWYVYDSSGLAAGGAAPMMVSVPAPATLPGRMLELGPDGPRWK